MAPRAHPHHTGRSAAPRDRRVLDLRRLKGFAGPIKKKGPAADATGPTMTPRRARYCCCCGAAFWPPPPPPANIRRPSAVVIVALPTLNESSRLARIPLTDTVSPTFRVSFRQPARNSELGAPPSTR